MGLDTHLIAGVGKWSTQTRTHPPSRKDKAKAPGGKEKSLNRQPMDGWMDYYHLFHLEDERRDISGRQDFNGRSYLGSRPRSKIKKMNPQNFEQ